MARRVYIHVGAPKTGTTYLQDRMRLNAASLAEHRVQYVVDDDMPTHFGAALDLIEEPWGGQRRHFVGAWEDRLMRRVRAADRDATLVISHEILAGARAEHVERAMADLSSLEGPGGPGDTEVHLVYTARDLGRQVPAEWQEGIKHRRQRTFGTFLEQIREAEHEDPREMWFWRVQHVPEVLARWGASLPPERIHLVLVPQSREGDDSLWSRWCRALGIDPAWAPKDSSAANSSIGVAEIKVLRELNIRLADADLPGRPYRRLVRQQLVHHNLAQREGMTKAAMPPDVHAWATDLARGWVEQLGASGCQVYGDLDELVPRPGPSAEEWVDPDDVPLADQLDVALDALTAMTEIAADEGRPDPTGGGAPPPAPQRRETLTLTVARRIRDRLRG